MPPDPVANERTPLIPGTPDPAAAPANSEVKGNVSFMPILALLFLALGAGWAVGHFQASFLWLAPVVAIIGGVTNRRILHFKRYLLHSIIRIGEKERVLGHVESTEWINLILERFWAVLEPVLSQKVIEKVNVVLHQNKPGFLDSLVLKEFTLGSNAPCVLGARSYPQTLPNVIVQQFHI